MWPEAESAFDGGAKFRRNKTIIEVKTPDGGTFCNDQ